MSEQGIKKRRAIKRQMIEAMGGKCVCCGYDKCDGALAFHHLDEKTKKIKFGSIKTYMLPWKTIVTELKKCILVCHNCHRLIHHNQVQIPMTAAKFNNEYTDAGTPTEPCEICGKLKPIGQTKKCPNCAKWLISSDIVIIEWNKWKNTLAVAKKLKISSQSVRRHLKMFNIDYPNNRIAWDDNKLIEMINNGLSYLKIAQFFGASDNGVKKRLKKLGLKSKFSFGGP